ncbi:MAG TPA: serine protease [Parcubacteria group bacterium]|jgi:hypothetical protein|nr:serine protease [Parcubacteria group bacterium]
MIIKTIVSLLIAPILFISQIFNTNSELVYTAPEQEYSVVKEILHDKSTSSPETVVKNPEIPEIKKKTLTPNTASQKKPEEIIAPKEVVPASTPIETPVDFEKINTDARKTTINILCTTKYGDLSPISGTGVIISSNGLVLTNAHIGQYFLLKDFREKDYLKCVGRTGSPAYPKYNLELVYISQNWVRANKSLLKEQNPKGTGEDDFAFLRITGNIDESNNQLKSFIEPNVRELINIGEPVLLASYPAGFLGGLSILRDLNITSSITNIQDIYTFKDGTIDVISVGGTVVSQKGSSGGLVVDKNTSLIGIITTSSDGNTTSSRGLNAITLGYINRTLQKELGKNMREFLELDHEKYAKEFSISLGVELSKLITDELAR